MSKMPDFSKIVENVKSMISSPQIPESAKNDPIGYKLSELSKTLNELVETHKKLGDEIAKLSMMLNSIYQEVLPLLKKEQQTKVEIKEI